MTKEKIFEPNFERCFDPGIYKVKLSFLDCEGKEHIHDCSDVVVEGAMGEKDFQDRIIRYDKITLGHGLHNLGMDTYYKRYPDGHPVKFMVTREDGCEYEFTVNYGGNGYPIGSK